MSKKITSRVIAFILAGILLVSGLPGLQNNTKVSAAASQSDEELQVIGEEEGFVWYSSNENIDQILNSDVSALSDSAAAYDSEDFVGTWEGNYAGYIFRDTGEFENVNGNLTIVTDQCVYTYDSYAKLSGTISFSNSEISNFTFYFLGEVSLETGIISLMATMVIDYTGDKYYFPFFNMQLESDKKTINGIVGNSGYTLHAERTGAAKRIGTVAKMKYYMAGRRGGCTGKSFSVQIC